jgi:hypothetical protein
MCAARISPRCNLFAAGKNGRQSLLSDDDPSNATEARNKPVAGRKARVNRELTINCLWGALRSTRHLHFVAGCDPSVQLNDRLKGRFISEKPMILFQCLVFFLFAFAYSCSGQTCKRVDQELTSLRRQRYVPQIAANTPGHPLPTDINIQRFMRAGEWTVIFAKLGNAERGVYFFRSTQGKDVLKSTWGGVLGTDEESDLISWTRSLDPHFPEQLAICFARGVASGE